MRFTGAHTIILVQSCAHESRLRVKGIMLPSSLTRRIIPLIVVVSTVYVCTARVKLSTAVYCLTCSVLLLYWTELQTLHYGQCIGI